MTYAYPLEWPDGWARTPTHQRREMRANRLTFNAILDKTYWELERLSARDVVISSWLDANLRGQPYAEKARRQLEDPGVAVYFTYRKKPMVMARDAFLTVADNLNSLRLAIQYLRGLERHGGGTMMDRAFDGFAKLPHPDKAGWKVILGNHDNLEDVERSYRQKAKEAAHGTTEAERHNEMVRLNLAVDEARQFFKGGKAA